MSEDTVDFVIGAWKEDGVWRTEKLPNRSADSISMLTQSLRANQSDGATLGLVSVGEDYFVIAKVNGPSTSFYLSDAAAALDSKLAANILEFLELDEPDEDDLDDIEPLGNELILNDWGVDESELDLLTGDLDMFPDEVLSAIAIRLGFGDQFATYVDLPLT